MKKTNCIMIAGGGTGGHIYPAIAIGKALIDLDPSYDVKYVGTVQGFEQKIMAKEKLELHLVRSGQLNFSGNPLKKLKTIISIFLGFFDSIRLILKFKPQYVLGVGGYASGPFLLAAAFMGVTTAVWEPNAHPGMANRLLSRFVKKAFVVFDEAKKYLKVKNVMIVGMPLRKEMELARVNSQRSTSDKLRILCTGGSQGSKFLNTQLSDLILNHPELHSKIHVIHQTGTPDFENMKKKYEGVSCVEVHEFIYNMPEYYQRSDVQFCRGGASTIAEAACFGVIPIVVPLPAADDHQQRNAEVLIKNKAGFMLLQNSFDKTEFKHIIEQLMKDMALRETMTAQLRALASKDAATTIAQDMLKEIHD